MGWLFSEQWPTRASMREHLCNGNGVRTIKSCWKGNNLWAVQEYTYPLLTNEGNPHPKASQTVQFIALYLVRWHGKDCQGWGYKDMDESAGPNYYNCPLAYLDMVPDPGGYATEWRAKVRALAERGKRKLLEGQRIKLYGKEYTVGKPRANGGVTVWDYDVNYRLKRSQIKDVEVLS